MAKIRVPATTANLGPGFDCLGMALSIYNHVTISREDGAPLRISATGPAATPDIPVDERNLVYKAVARVFELAGKQPKGIKLELELESPLARGLGSSASAIVGGMFVANELLGRPLSMEQLALEVTRMEGHPDNVIPCLVGGLTASIGLEDRVLYEKVLPATQLRCVLFIPNYELETATARGVMPKQISMKDAVFNGCRIPFVLSRLSSGDLSDLDVIMDDRLHQPYRIPLIKGYKDVRDAALDAGAGAVCISGAGPTILAVCTEQTADAVAAAGSQALSAHRVVPDIRIATPDFNGCVVEG